MATSEISICNMALTLIGADSIRSFTESNKRARLLEKTYTYMREYLLATADWNFARKYTQLAELDTSGEDVPNGEKAYQLPHDCHVVRELVPKGSKDSWSIMQDRLYTSLAGDIYIYYTAKAVDVALFPEEFTHVLSLGIAARVAYPITQDKQAARMLNEQFQMTLLEVMASDANIGSSYRARDEDPNYDTFVTGGDAAYDPEDESRFLVTE